MERTIIFLGSTGHGSGAERVLEYLLAGAVAQRESFCLIAPPSSSVSSFARELGYPWIPWHSDHDGLRQNTSAFLRLLRHEGRTAPGDLVHAWHTRHLEWALLLGRRWGLPTAGTIHDDPDPSHHQFGVIRKKIIRSAAARLDGLAVVSSAVARRCGELGWQRTPAILRNGLPDAPPSPPQTGSHLRLGFLATGLKWKGLRVLEEALPLTDDLPLQWNLFGSRHETGAELDALRRHPKVDYFGVVPLAEALARTDVLLHLSLNLDPYPTVLLEAARAGIPVIASSAGGAPEIVDDGSTGVLIPPGDSRALAAAIRLLASDSDARTAMGMAARRKFEAAFRVERMVADYLAFWNRLRAPRA